MLAAAAALVVALGLDNAAVAAGVDGDGQRWNGALLRLGVAALALAFAGAAAGRLVRLWLPGWAPLMGAVMLFSLWVDALRLAAGNQPRLVPADTPASGPAWRGVFAACGATLDELGVGFAFGSLAAGTWWAWGLACLAETGVGFFFGIRVRSADSGRRLTLWGAAALFCGSALTLLLWAPTPARVP